MENAIVLGAGAVAVELVTERDATVANYWVARVEGAVAIENQRWSGGGEK